MTLHPDNAFRFTRVSRLPLLPRLTQQKRPTLPPKALKLIPTLTERANEVEAEIIHAGIDGFSRDLFATADA